MAAVLVLGLLYTVLAGAAMRGLRSEGTDRRRADAAMIADRALSTLETDIATGVVVADGLTERQEDPFVVRTEIAPADVLEMLPEDIRKDVQKTTDPKAPSVFHDERGKSRMRRLSVVVAWDEAGQPAQVERTTYSLDTAGIAAMFPTAGAPGANSPLSQTGPDALHQAAPPTVQSLTGGSATGAGSGASSQ
jgi:hypothetical protein